MVRVFLIFGLPPNPVTVTNEAVEGFPTKNVLIKKVTVTGWGVDPIYNQQFQGTIILHGL